MRAGDRKQGIDKCWPNGPTWLSGEIKEIRGPLSYTVLLLDG